MDVHNVEFDDMMESLIEADRCSAQKGFGSSYTTLCGNLEKHQQIERRHKKAIYGIVLPLIALFIVANVWLINHNSNEGNTHFAQENYEEGNIDFFAEINDF